MSNLLRRAITTVIAIPLVVFVLIIGKLLNNIYPVVLLAAMAAMIAALEYSQMLERNGIRLHRWLFIASAGGLMVVYGLFEGPASDLGLTMAFILSIIAYLFDPDALRKILATMGGLFYVPYLLRFFYPIYRAPEGLLYASLALVMVWAYDIGAYLLGSRWGRHKFAPSISPLKSWEGVVGGFALCLFMTSTVSVWGSWMNTLVSRSTPMLWSEWSAALPHVVMLATIVSFFTQLGDLIESRLKRFMQVKDAGGFMPGHGGLLDRIDGLLLALPAFYFYFHFMLRLM